MNFYYCFLNTRNEEINKHPLSGCYGCPYIPNFNLKDEESMLQTFKYVISKNEGWLDTDIIKAYVILKKAGLLPPFIVKETYIEDNKNPTPTFVYENTNITKTIVEKFVKPKRKGAPRDEWQLKNGSNNKAVSQAIYGFCIDIGHTDALTNEEINSDVEFDDLLNDIAESIRITGETENFRYFLTDFEFEDDVEFGDSSVLIIGIPFNTLKAHYSGVMWVQPDLSIFDESYMKSFIKDNSRFEGVRPQVVVYTNMHK